MFGDSVKSAALGTGILLGALGLASGVTEAGTLTVDPPSQTSAVKVESDGMLNQATHVNRLSGPLQHAKAPVYDGPVMWGGADMSVALGVLAGMCGAAMGGGITLMATADPKKSFVGMTLSGLALGLAVGANVTRPAEVVTFETRIQSVEKTFEPIGKIESRFSQHLRIPETDLLLFADGLKSPFVEGQKVKVSFYLNQEGNINGWFASVGARDIEPNPQK